MQFVGIHTHHIVHEQIGRYKFIFWGSLHQAGVSHVHGKRLCNVKQGTKYIVHIRQQ